MRNEKRNESLSRSQLEGVCQDCIASTQASTSGNEVAQTTTHIK